jgi:hypothetical protein
MKILFLHGWHSIVGGVKPTYLKQAGHQVLNPALDDVDFDAALATAEELYRREQPDVIVGSSRGGAVAMNIESGHTPLVLLCPAWKNWGQASRVKSTCCILHSRRDEVIPFADSLELATRSGLPTELLVEIGSDHRLADPHSLAVMEWVCQMLVQGDLEFAQSLQEWSQGDTTCIEATRQVAVDGAYLCDACGESIVIPLDVSEGSSQSYVEDCPVCCRANVIHVEIQGDGQVEVWAEPEHQD